MARKNNISGKAAREMLKGMTARDIKKMSHGELVSLAKAAQNEIRADIRRFKKAGVFGGAFALNAFKESTTPHDYKYTYYSVKEKKNITKVVHVNPGVRYMSRINANKSASDLAQYLYRAQSYFSDDTRTNTVEGISKHQRYLRFYMGGGRAIYDESGKAVDWIPSEMFTDEEVKKFYDIYNAARKAFGGDFSNLYQAVRDAIVYNMRNGGDVNFNHMSADEAGEWLNKNRWYVDDPSGVFQRGSVFE